MESRAMEQGNGELLCTGKLTCPYHKSVKPLP